MQLEKILSVALFTLLLAVPSRLPAQPDQPGEQLRFDFVQPAPGTESETIESQSEKSTRIRLGKPTGVFQTGAYILLAKADVVAKNVGSVDAQGVAVFVIAPSGKEFQLNGPTTLPARSEFTYSAAPNDIVLSGRDLKARFTCSNCYK